MCALVSTWRTGSGECPEQGACTIRSQFQLPILDFRLFTSLTQILKYEVGQFYKSHHDQNSGLFTPQGARVYTFFMYLSTPEEGGGTRFTDLGLVRASGTVAGVDSAPH